MPRIHQKPDHQGAAHIIIPKNQGMLHVVGDLNKALQATSDKTIVRATTTNTQQSIYFRHASKVPSCLRQKNRAEIEANRSAMRNTLSDLAASFEKKLGKAEAQKEREAVACLNDLAAARGGDITVADIRQPLGIIDARLGRMKRLDTIKKLHTSPAPNPAQRMKSMLRQFDCMGDIEKTNLKKMLFSSAPEVTPLKQEVILNQMQMLVTMLRKNPEARASEIAEKFCEMPNLERFVAAWLLVRPDGDNGKTGLITQDHQFAWRHAMDSICQDLRTSIFVKGGGAASGKSSPAYFSDSPLSPVGRTTFKPRHKNTGQKVQLHRKRLGSTGDETALDTLIKQFVTPDGKANPQQPALRSVQIGKVKSRPTNMLTPPNSYAGSIGDDSPPSPSFPRPLRTTESGILEQQIIKFTVAEAKAKAGAEIARMQLNALLHSRLADAASSQSAPALRFSTVQKNIMSVPLDKAATVTDSVALPLGSVDDSLERLLPALHIGATDPSGSAQTKGLANAEGSSEDSLQNLIDRVYSPEPMVRRSSSARAVIVDSVALSVPFDPAFLLHDDALLESAPASPVVIDTAEKERTQEREKA